MTTTTPPTHAQTSIARMAVLLTALAGALTWNVLQVAAPSEDDALVAPPLALPDSRCGVGSVDSEELRARSTQLAAAARTHLERYPFRPADGPSALELLVEASACAAQAGADAEAATLAARAQRFHRRLEADYRDRQLRIERALADGQPRRALADVVALAAQLEGEDHPFARRMRNLRAALADGERK